MSTIITEEKIKQLLIELRLYKQDAMTAAKDLGYDIVVLHKIKCANTCAEISNIMKTARNAK